MATGPHSAGEIGGILAGVLAVLASIGAGIRWLLGWKERREASFYAKLVKWEEALNAREKAFEGGQQAHFARIETRLVRAEGQVEATLNGYHLISSALRAQDPHNVALGMADEILKEAFRLDPIVPDDMKAELGKMN